jgi:hypothetical protein
LPAYAQAAKAEVELRMAEFQLKVLQRFEADVKARRDAFAEPDFQATVIAAQRAHARSGDEGVCSVLVDLIARRSAESRRSRLSLSLNQAVEKAAALTGEEFAALALCYLAKYTQFHVPNYSTFVEYLKSHYVPFIPEVPEESSVFQYLEAQGCGGQGLSNPALHDILKENYAGVLNDGAKEEAFVAATSQSLVADLKQQQLLISCFHNPEHLQIGSLDRRKFQDLGKNKGVSDDTVNKVWSVFEPTIWNATTMRTKLTQDVPEMERLFEVWAKSGLGSGTLTSVGTAIAHASISGRVKDFDADLSVWIR